jgi:hypothetical protein
LGSGAFSGNTRWVDITNDLADDRNIKTYREEPLIVCMELAMVAMEPEEVIS